MSASQFVGTSTSRVTVFVDPSLGASAVQNADDLLADADRVVAKNNEIFGADAGPANVMIFALDGRTDGTGGADHSSCDFTSGNNIEVDASFGNSARVSALFEAEFSECMMNGNLCGLSTGEALSRWCAAVVSNNALSDFATAPIWVADGMPNWVDSTAQTDRDDDGNGCGVAFISWLLSTGQTLEQVARGIVALGDSGTLAQLYGNLTGGNPNDAWPNFRAAVQALGPGGVKGDDPFGSVFPAR